MPEVPLLAGGWLKLEFLVSHLTPLSFLAKQMACCGTWSWVLIMPPPPVGHGPEADLFGLDQHLGAMGVKIVHEGCGIPNLFEESSVEMVPKP